MLFPGELDVAGVGIRAARSALRARTVDGRKKKNADGDFARLAVLVGA